MTVNWFETDLKYAGEGRAEFSHPKIILEGPTRIQFKDLGMPNIQMDYKNIKGDVDPRLKDLLNRSVSVSEYRAIADSVHQLEENKCTKLEVVTANGIFSSIGIHIRHYVPDSLRSVLKFSVLTSQFETRAGEPKYWVIPLYNFIPYFHKYPSKQRHPLNINDKYISINFQFNGLNCFIEPLDDYETIKNELINYQKPKGLTALMIGELKSKSQDFDSLEREVPLNFLELPGVATGTEIGSPWVEFRTEDSDLVKRIHVELNNPIYSKGHVTR